MKTVNLAKESNITATGTHNNGNCKPVVCLTDGTRFTSVTDAAEYAGVHITCMSSCCIGKIKTCNGKVYRFVSRVGENLDEVFDYIHSLSSVKEKARLWDEHEAERRAIAERAERREKLRQSVAKLEEKLAQERNKLSELEDDDVA